MSDERILGESDFVDKIFGMEVAEIFSPGRQDVKGKARSLVCFWAARKLGMSISDLARLCHEYSRHQLLRDDGREPCPEQELHSEGLR